MSYFTDDWKIYNSNIINLKVNDAVKLTSSNDETFWVEIYEINDNNNIIGIIVNSLIKEHEYKIYDKLSFNINNIKELKKQENRFIVTEEDYKYFCDFIKEFKHHFNRMPTNAEVDEIANVRYSQLNK